MGWRRSCPGESRAGMLHHWASPSTPCHCFPASVAKKKGPNIPSEWRNGLYSLGERGIAAVAGCIVVVAVVALVV